MFAGKPQRKVPSNWLEYAQWGMSVTHTRVIRSATHTCVGILLLAGLRGTNAQEATRQSLPQSKNATTPMSSAMPHCAPTSVPTCWSVACADGKVGRTGSRLLKEQLEWQQVAEQGDLANKDECGEACRDPERDLIHDQAHSGGEKLRKPDQGELSCGRP